MALSLARMGMDVVLTFNTNQAEAEAEAVVEEIAGLGARAAALRFDLTDIAAIDGFIDQLKATLRDAFDAMGRLAEPHDIGGLVALLCSDDARWLTGQRLEATGGFNI